MVATLPPPRLTASPVGKEPPQREGPEPIDEAVAEAAATAGERVGESMAAAVKGDGIFGRWLRRLGF